VFSKVVTVLDSSIPSSSSIFAIHANSSSQTLFLSGKDIETYLKKLENAETKVQELDFSTLATAAVPVAHASKAPAKEKESAKIEGAVQIAIGVKKEVDFPGWYTNVGP
jgi:prolyl-tRNA synthetase